MAPVESPGVSRHRRIARFHFWVGCGLLMANALLGSGCATSATAPYTYESSPADDSGNCPKWVKESAAGLLIAGLVTCAIVGRYTGDLFKNVADGSH